MFRIALAIMAALALATPASARRHHAPAPETHRATHHQPAKAGRHGGKEKAKAKASEAKAQKPTARHHKAAAPKPADRKAKHPTAREPKNGRHKGRHPAAVAQEKHARHHTAKPGKAKTSMPLSRRTHHAAAKHPEKARETGHGKHRPHTRAARPAQSRHHAVHQSQQRQASHRATPRTSYHPPHYDGPPAGATTTGSGESSTFGSAFKDIRPAGTSGQ